MELQYIILGPPNVAELGGIVEVFGFKGSLAVFALSLVSLVLTACGTAPAAAVAPQIIEVERIVERTIPVETVREVVKEVPVEKQVVVEKEVIREIPVEKVIEVEKIVEVVRDRDPGTLVVYSGRSESLVGPIIEQFEEVTGVNVAVKYGSTGEIAATILEEGDRSPADVFFAQDPGGLGEVANAGLFETLPSSITSKVPTWARSPESEWVGISGRARVVVYNAENLTSDQIPTKMEDFTKPEWKGRIGWAPTNGSFQAMVTAMRVVWGEEKTREWLLGIQANDPKVYAKNTPTVAAAAAGEVDVGFVNHYYLHRFLAEEGEDFAARNYHVADGGPGGMILVAGGGILKSAENKDNAERFFNFMLSRVAQQYFAGQTYEYPLVDGVKTNRILTPLDEINNPVIDMASLDDLAGTQIMLRDLGILQ